MVRNGLNLWYETENVWYEMHMVRNGYDTKRLDSFLMIDMPIDRVVKSYINIIKQKFDRRILQQVYIIRFIAKKKL